MTQHEQTMKAAIIREWGGPDVVEYADFPTPTPKPSEVLVKVEACALNHLDIHVRRGLPGVKLELPHISGGDIVGRIACVGSEEDAPLVGQRAVIQPIIGHGVIGEHYRGGLAEYAVAPTANVILLDDADGPSEKFAALPIAYGTALRMLFTRGRLTEGESILILGATGGMGVACVQFAVQAGARVIACSTSDEKLAKLRELGAQDTINVAVDSFRARTKEIVPGGVDVVVDYQGRETWPDSLRTVRQGGRILTCGATTGYEAITDLRYVFAREMDIIGSAGWTPDDCQKVIDMARAGEIEAPIHGIFPLSRAQDAIAELEDRRAFGKVIVVPDGVGS